nr:hypothetical protein CFP56_73554 [Quercus suber]
MPTYICAGGVTRVFLSHIRAGGARPQAVVVIVARSKGARMITSSFEAQPHRPHDSIPPRSNLYMLKEDGSNSIDDPDNGHGLTVSRRRSVSLDYPP